MRQSVMTCEARPDGSRALQGGTRRDQARGARRSRLPMSPTPTAARTSPRRRHANSLTASRSRVARRSPTLRPLHRRHRNPGSRSPAFGAAQTSPGEPSPRGRTEATPDDDPAGRSIAGVRHVPESMELRDRQRVPNDGDRDREKRSRAGVRCGFGGSARRCELRGWLDSCGGRCHSSSSRPAGRMASSGLRASTQIHTWWRAHCCRLSASAFVNAESRPRTLSAFRRPPVGPRRGRGRRWPTAARCRGRRLVGDGHRRGAAGCRALVGVAEAHVVVCFPCSACACW